MEFAFLVCFASNKITKSECLRKENQFKNYNFHAAWAEKKFQNELDNSVSPPLKPIQQVEAVPEELNWMELDAIIKVATSFRKSRSRILQDKRYSKQY